MKNILSFIPILFLVLNCKSDKKSDNTNSNVSPSNNKNPKDNYAKPSEEINQGYSKIIDYLNTIEDKKSNEKILKQIQTEVDKFVYMHKGVPIDKVYIEEILNKLINRLPKKKPKSNFNLYIDPIKKIIKTDSQNCNTYYTLIKNFLKKKYKNEKSYYKYKKIYE